MLCCIFRVFKGQRGGPPTLPLHWDVGVCVCLCAQSACTPSLLAVGVRCGCVCLGSGFGCAPPLLAGVCGVCVLGCALPLYPATRSWGLRRGCVCYGSGFGCAPPLLARVLGCVCACVHSACTPPVLAGLWGVGVCAWAQVSAAPRHPWLGCWGVCVFVCALRLYQATSGSGVR